MNHTIKTISRTGVTTLIVLLGGCSGALGNTGAADPTERGLSYVAAAIITAALIRTFL